MTTSLLVAALLAASPVAPTSSSPPERLATLAATLWDEWLELNPLAASELGDHRFDDRFGDGLSEAHRSAVRGWAELGLAAAGDIDPTTLDDDDRLTLELLRRWLQSHLDDLAWPGHLMPIDHFISSPQNVLAQQGSGGGAVAFATPADYERFARRCVDFRRWTAVATARLREGVERGVVLPCQVVDAALAQVAEQVVDDPRASPFWGPMERLPSGLDRTQRRHLEALWREMITSQVVPAYRDLQTALEEVARPACRSTLSLSALPEGRAWYGSLVRYYTTSERTPEELFTLGVKECQRIILALDDLARDNGWAGAGDLLRELATERRHFLAGQGVVLRRYGHIRDRVEARLAQLFLRRPTLALDIRPVDPILAATAPGGFYTPPDPSGQRPGVFHVNAARALSPVRGMEALFLHEALPGHHLQRAVALEAGDLPAFRRHGYQGAFVEGWALYAEGLGSDLGLYDDPVQQAGRLLSDLLRAARLVVDVGIHHGGWTREQAESLIRTQLLGVNLGELDRYAVRPAQALAYKVGEQAILDLRRRAERRLGPSFDPRTFHHEILRRGALPLDLLEREVSAWIERRAHDVER